MLDKSPPISDVFRGISYEKALTIFNTVASRSGKTDVLTSTLDCLKNIVFGNDIVGVNS
jgi:hypothetical protein